MTRMPLIVPIAFLLAIYHGPAGVAGPPVEGDAALLVSLQNIHATNYSSLPSGRSSVSVIDRVSRYGAVVTVLWSGENTRWEGVTHEVVVRDGNDGAAREKLVPHPLRMIETSQQVVCYWPDLRFVDIINNGKGRYREELQLKPSQAWYSFERIVPWQELFDPENTKRTQHLSKFVVREEGDNRIVVERHYDTDVLTIVCSMAQGGNVIEYWSDPKKGTKGFRRKGTYEWQKQSSGNWILKRCKCQRYDPDSDLLAVDYELDVTSCEPLGAIPSTEFSFESLNVAPGCVIEETGVKRRRYRAGEKASGIDQVDLDRLIDFLRSTGFGAADRSKEKN
ncbi:MAG: hypothetical protein JSS02_21225 [Planctomycetes bacterium]|nr:hypothetical protein [Planctomycetota bacterium]